MHFLRLVLAAISASLALASSLSTGEGYCSMYGSCGKRSIFGGQLPCPTDRKAEAPSLEELIVLQRVCGKSFDKTCCSMDQLLNMESSLKRVDPLISSCPACRRNFYDFICDFTCSPNQASFVEVTKTSQAVDTKQDIVTEITQYVDPKYAEAFFDSCKNVKFSATNGFAMDLIGGGAKNYQQFLKFLGDEKPLLGGSPFQINYSYKKDKSELFLPRSGDMKSCDDETYRCACSDCAQSCPQLPSFNGYAESCHIGPLACFSFSIIIIWAALIFALGIYHMFLHKKKLKLPDEDNSINSLLVNTNSPSVSPTASFQQNIISGLQEVFETTGYYCAKFPGVTIGFSLVIVILLSSGLLKLELETDPTNLWVSPEEPALKNMQFFESNFGEWFRIEQLIVSSRNDEPILNWDNIKWWFEKEAELETLNANVSLSDICFKPLGETCGIQSFTQYFQGDINYLNENNWKQNLKSCTDSPVNCLPSFQQPLKPNILFDNDSVLDSKAFIVTILINSNLSDENYTQSAIEFEHLVQDWVTKVQSENSNVTISYSTEISLTEELNKSTNTDIKIVVISYICMFLYASLALGGKWPKATLSFLIRTRFLLGLGGITIILMSILSSAGLCAVIGLKSTLIIAEVIPFLILAIGVDNIFLIVHELNNISAVLPDALIETRIALAMGNIGPSCLLSATLQFFMFLIATRVDMPAVKNFAYYSAGAILINFLLQMTTFVALLSVDQKRVENRRLDCVPWIQLDEVPEEKEQWNLVQFIKEKYAPAVLSKSGKRKVITFFVLWTGVSLSLMPLIQMGLDQRTALPQGSYLIDYFDAMYQHLNVGPPVFFVMKDLDVTQRENQQRVCGKFSACDRYSVANILEQEYKRKDVSTIQDPASSWIDDFLGWLNPDLDECCRVKKSSPLEIEFCSANAPARQCQPCYQDHSPAYNTTMEGFPTGAEFMTYFNQWIQSPSDPCPLGGKAPYDTSIARTAHNITASYFRAGHKPLKSQQDFIVAYQNSLRIVKEIKQYNDIDMFAFSPFYVFFVQYETIIQKTFLLLSGAVAVIVAISSFMLGWKRAAVLGVVVVSVLIDMGGVMAIAGISLNAVSLVNLVICGGLAVEFAVHITKASSNAENAGLSQEFRSDELLDHTSEHGSAFHALTTVGPTTITGITLTKLIGIFVLAFTSSKIFEIYYFRMWLGLVAVAAAHSLCLLPVLLSYL
ncbi:uncharacterized protein CANTADRAFT_26879 [Suhomyces tanzawaensis NRRL Y-17324]|uniref:SSD domain-containing protein n=1 Tax=Suhomyces tanzawaensis NRRL Y-17324 TaxID=984487 RepID=A0A1E4SEF9_9ASCO|nr:uncharacterized protein CANTADRAFT_26879 [Suhomyces tanzawaensis NRRL Y-17324]ODV77860.1 hypothetical protein CANTADRAFT_26879 [Suhomyces tanzawaensis NRRL Y-17324]